MNPIIRLLLAVLGAALLLPGLCSIFGILVLFDAPDLTETLLSWLLLAVPSPLAAWVGILMLRQSTKN